MVNFFLARELFVFRTPMILQRRTMLMMGIQEDVSGLMGLAEPERLFSLPLQAQSCPNPKIVRIIFAQKHS